MRILNAVSVNGEDTAFSSVTYTRNDIKSGATDAAGSDIYHSTAREIVSD